MSLKPLPPSEEFLPPCKICGKVWQRKDALDRKWVYHDSVGVVCCHHHGVKEWYQDLLTKSLKELEKIDCFFLEDTEDG